MRVPEPERPDPLRRQTARHAVLSSQPGQRPRAQIPTSDPERVTGSRLGPAQPNSSHLVPGRGRPPAAFTLR
jgi:hypothetical protein